MTAAPAPRFLDRTTPPHITTLILVAGVGALSTSIFLPSLAHMAEHFDTSYAVMQFAVSGYLLTTAVLQVVLGSVADTLGRRPVMLGVAVHLRAGHLGDAGRAERRAAFLAFRMLQGLAVAGIVLARAVVRDTVGQDEAASRIGYITMGMALIPMIGPMIGGALDEACRAGRPPSCSSRWRAWPFSPSWRPTRARRRARGARGFRRS
jgi:DHA1 family bicyclomycin/chloramphenicol resistance-like MFS transporter